MPKTIWITHIDKNRLMERVEEAKSSTDYRDTRHLEQLVRELGRAEVFSDSDQVPSDLITMRSRVRLKNLSTGRELPCTLVYPEESDPDQSKISVVAPLGVAMLGCRIGDSFEVVLPRGAVTFIVESIEYQPEAAGDSTL